MPDTFWTKFGSFVRSGATGQQQFACFGRSNSVADWPSCRPSLIEEFGGFIRPEAHWADFIQMRVLIYDKLQ